MHELLNISFGLFDICNLLNNIRIDEKFKTLFLENILLILLSTILSISQCHSIIKGQNISILKYFLFVCYLSNL